MADKRIVRDKIRKLEQVKTWQLVVLILIAGLIAASFLRLNNVGMMERRAAVIAADEAGDSTETADRLYDLLRYVSAHMNTDMGVIYLQGQYDRDYQDRINAATRNDSTEGNVYKRAEEACRARYPDYSAGTYLAYQQCFIDQLNSYGPGQSLEQAIDPPRAEEYRHTMISPVWSPDFAGFSVLAFLALVIVLVVRIIILLVLRLLLRVRYRSA